MKNEIVLVQHLDSINNRLININSRLDNINSKILPNNLFGTLLVPIIVGVFVGVVIFILTKKKEILFKKAEVAGEIFMRLYQLKKLRADYAYVYLNKCAFEACVQLETNENVDIDSIKKLFEIGETDKLAEINLKRDNLINDLMKYVGQYKFYISNNEDKIKLEQKIVVIHLTHQKHELFENCNSVDEILVKQEKLMLEKFFDNNFEIQIQEMFNEIEKIISKN